ncbi:DegT/DnrJ/EryC1/StrS family aminotransferase [Thauera humireducens]|uniref:DegT/DnrJ/EryC1/StrS aminotransferase n=1 Tax=Thauera humireducens TaxID=1134435 RepID=A0A140ID82_9RHOO|nr:aminotransferase class I/II-fold pyridoxal phosphate-dependent enzyme [Thauera humireducens]AMO35707.1 DegT/DnrJ/EryC1/StrS aminotransferase [Thauera humireducens]
MTDKHAVADLALFGGRPLFDRPRPIGQLAKPDTERFFSLMKSAFDSRRLSNNGPLVQELEARLADYHAVRHCIAYANAGLALITLIETIADGRKGSVVIPTFTYTGLPHIVRWAGLTPVFCDVAPDTHTLTATSVADALRDDTIMMLGVHQANSPCPIDELSAMCEQFGLPLLFDAVHGLGATFRGKPIGGFGIAEVFSLHATKLLNGFEGGYITTNDDELAALMRRKRNFGYSGESSIDTLGLNGKLNEVHAASALASLDKLPVVISRNHARLDAYQQAFRGIPGISWIPYPGDEATNAEFPLLKLATDWPIPRDALVSILRAEGALARAYYAPALHLQDDSRHRSLPVAEALAQCIVQMPTGEMVNTTDIARLASLVQFVSSNAAAIRAALAAHQDAK